ncbi:MAG: hypothetical protein IID18_04570, partial [Nitrospinae bacterium]|nr:hypothetical protein [Nitrospinota bacterium]
MTLGNFGQSKAVGLKVVDARPSNIIARWTGRFSFRKFTVSPDSDLTDTMRRKVSEGLSRTGFHPKRIEKESTRTLRVEILRLKSVYREKLPTLDVRTEVLMRAHCNNRENRYSATYADRKRLNSVPPSTFPNERLINDTLSEVLRTMFSDKKLLSCL